MRGDYVNYQLKVREPEGGRPRRLKNQARVRRRALNRYYHVSPYRILPGMHIRPRWCPYLLDSGAPLFAVCMFTTLKRAEKGASSIFEGFSWGIGGFGGTTLEDPGELAEIKGLWIYRVAPTGPLLGLAERAGMEETAFPVRVLAVAGSYREPERNACVAPSPAFSDREAAAVFSECMRTLPSRGLAGLFFEKMWHAFRDSHDPDREVHRAGFLGRLDLHEFRCDQSIFYRHRFFFSDGPDPRMRRRERAILNQLFDAFVAASDEAQARTRYHDLARMEEARIAEEMAQQRRRIHRRLRPDPRYRRPRQADVLAE